MVLFPAGKTETDGRGVIFNDAVNCKDDMALMVDE